MKRLEYQYPQDPIDTCFVMNRLEFLQVFPRRPIEIHTRDKVESIAMLPDEICCDFCNADPLDEIYLINQGTRALCKQCANKYVIPYVKG